MGKSVIQFHFRSESYFQLCFVKIETENLIAIVGFWEGDSPASEKLPTSI